MVPGGVAVLSEVVVSMEQYGCPWRVVSRVLSASLKVLMYTEA